MNKFFAMMLVFLTIPAFGKITLFSATHALNHVLSSSEYLTAVRQLPAGVDLTSIDLDQTGSAPNNSFEIKFVYEPRMNPPSGIKANCFIIAYTHSHVFLAGPNHSITVSELTIPEVTGPTCQR